MKFYKALQIGDYHVNHCEDYLFTGEIGSDKIVCAVMDGCTTAIDSYFISTMVGKILRKICIERSYKEMYEPQTQAVDVDNYLKSLLQDLFKELRFQKNQLMLEPKEMLTTLIIMLVYKKSNQGIVLVIGDGLVSINGNVNEFDHDNKPDYLGYHLAEEFDAWYAKQIQKITFDSIEDVSIATDGISMFTKTSKVGTNTLVDPIHFLLSDKENEDQEDMLSSKIKKLDRLYGLKPTDDLAIIRILK